MRKFDKDTFKAKIEQEYGSIENLKHFLEYDAEDTGFDVRFTEVEIDGVKVRYSGNPNHFAKFYVAIGHVGMTGTYALDYDSYTRAGKKRGSTHGTVIF